MLPANDPAEEILGGELATLVVERVAVAVVGRLAIGSDAPASSQRKRYCVLPCTSLNTKVLAFARPGWALGPTEAGGNARWIAVMPSNSDLNDGSMTMMSGSG